MRPVKTNVKEITALYKRGYGIRKISKLLNVPKSTVYVHTSKIFGKKIKKVSFNPNLEKELGEIIGAFIGDGSFSFVKRSYAYFFRFYLSGQEMEYATMLSNMIKRVFGKNSRIRRDHHKDLIILAFESKEIYNLLRRYIQWDGRKSHTIRLVPPISRYSKIMLKGIISGLIATDGCIPASLTRIFFTTVSEELSTQVVKILAEFGIKSHQYFYAFPHTVFGRKERGQYYLISISHRENITKFKTLIDIAEPIKSRKLDLLINKYNGFKESSMGY